MKLFGFALLALHVAASAQTAPSVFGLRFGERPAIPYCAGSGRHQPEKGLCINQNLATKKPYSGEAKVISACCELPGWVSGSALNVELVEGRLERMFIITNGVAEQRNVLQALIDKFGKPVSLSTQQLQNGFGARFDAIEAGWVSAAVRVDMIGIVHGTDKGAVTIETPVGRDAVETRRLQTPRSGIKF